MAFSPQTAITAARSIWAGPRIIEARRLNFIANAVSPPRAYSVDSNLPWSALGSGKPTVEMPDDAPLVMRNLAYKSRTNYLPLILDSFSQLTKADGYVEANGRPSKAWSYWQANGLDARQTGIHRSAMQFGASYASILPGTTAPVIKGYSPRRMTAVYQDPDIDDWPMMAIDVNGPMVTLFDETMRYRIGIENYPISGLGVQATFVPQQPDWHFIDAQEHGSEFCPIARFRDRMLLDGEEVFGLIEPLIEVQKRIDETTFGLMVAQYYQAFKQRYVIGWVPKSEKELLEATAAGIWTFADPDVKVGDLGSGDPSPYITAQDAAKADMAALAQLPASALGSSTAAMRNVSPEAVASNDAGQDRKGGEIRTSLGETWELVLRAAAALDGDEASASDTSSQLRWRDMTTTSPGAIVQALGLMQSQLGIPAEMLWERIPGWTDQDQARAEELIRSGDTLDKLMVTLSKQAAPVTGPAGGAPIGEPNIPEPGNAAGLGG